MSDKSAKIVSYFSVPCLIMGFIISVFVAVLLKELTIGVFIAFIAGGLSTFILASVCQFVVLMFENKYNKLDN